MVEKIIGNFSVKYLQVLDESGKVDKKLMPKLSKQQIKDMYKAMVLAKEFDAKTLIMQRQGKIGTLASHRGQEGCQIGSIFALEKDDWVFPSFRENAALITFGVPMDKILAFWGGDTRGNALPKGINAFTPSVPVGTHLLHAMGVAWGMNLKKKKNATVCFFGDGATSEGDFNAALNFAGVFNAPVVFLCQNNQYAISLKRENQTKAKTIAQKAIAYGFEGIQIDGNDVFACYKAVGEALKKAKSGKGPTLIEFYTYRLGDHTTADSSIVYRDKKEVDQWKKKDPITRLRKYMELKKMWSKKDEEKLLGKVKNDVNAAAKKYEEMSKPDPDDIFQFLYANMPRRLEEQKEYLKQYILENGDQP